MNSLDRTAGSYPFYGRVRGSRKKGLTRGAENALSVPRVSPPRDYWTRTPSAITTNPSVAHRDSETRFQPAVKA